MLFLPDDVHSSEFERDERQAARYFRWLAGELQNENLTLLVLLVPNKYTIYRSLLANPPPRAPDGAPFLVRLEQAVRETGVAVVNLTDCLCRKSAEDFERGEYSYFLDDSHWNARGVSYAAEEIIQYEGGSFGRE